MSLLEKAPANFAYLGSGVIAAVMALAVFVGGAKAGDCPRSKSTKATSIGLIKKLTKKLKSRPDDVY